MPDRLPQQFDDVDALEAFMTTPDDALIADLAALDGPIMVLGAGGKMGPTLARLARRAAPDKQVFAVARFSEPGLANRLDSAGIETIACDLLDPQAVGALPRAANVIYMAGRKFGSTGAESLTWAANAHVPALVADAFRDARIVAFSTGCVYPFVPVAHGGATEQVPPNPPAGEYAWSCVARERVFQWASQRDQTPVCLFRLNYALDLRYGVLHDVAQAVYAGTPIDVTMGHVNAIWQGDANARALRALGHCASPAVAINISGPETISVRALAHAFAERFGVDAHIEGVEASHAWLSDTSRSMSLFGYPRVPLATMIDWTAAWIEAGRPSLGKPTHFETRDGSF